MRFRNALLALSPFALSFGLVYFYGVNFLFYDEWEFFPIFEKYFNRTLSLQDFLAQHTESRMLVPRLVVLALGLASGWNVKVEMYFIQFVQVLIASILIILATRSRPRVSKGHTLFACVLASILLSSFSQWRNFVTSFQLVMYLPNLFLVVALLVSRSRLKRATQLFVAGVCALLGTLSFANGLLLWVVIPIALFGISASALKKQIVPLLCWIASAALVIGLYFKGFAHPAHHPGIETLFRKPFEVLHGFLLLVALPFKNAHFPPSDSFFIFLAALCICFTLVFVILFLTEKDAEKISQARPWIALSAYGFATLLIIACGRTDFGEGALLAPRYGAFAVYAWIPLPFLQMILGQDKLIRYTSVALLLFCIPAHLAMSLEKIPLLEQERQLRHRGISAVQLLNVAWRYDVGHYTTPDGDKLIRNSELLTDWGFLPKKLDNSSISYSENTSSVLSGEIERRILTASSQPGIQLVSARGWLHLPQLQYKNIVVLATVRVEERPRKIAAYTYLDRLRPDIAKRLSISQYTYLAWNVQLRKLNNETLEFWALNTITGLALPISQKTQTQVILEPSFGSDVAIGNFDLAKPLFGNWFQFVGWLSPQEPDTVLITKDCDAGTRTIVSITFPGLSRNDVTKELGETFLDSGWSEAAILKEENSEDAEQCNLQAWAYNLKTNKAYPIAQAIRLAF